MSTPTRILVVEDEARIAEVVQSYLEREGHMVVRAATGEDALVVRWVRPEGEGKRPLSRLCAELGLKVGDVL